MTEAEWLTATDPEPMLEFLMREWGSDRKLRLWAVGACSFIWKHHDVSGLRDGVTIVERYADGLAIGEELEAVEKEAWACYNTALVRIATRYAAAAVALAAAGEDFSPTGASSWLVDFRGVVGIEADWSAGREADWEEHKATARREQCHLLRELFGNLFRPVAVDFKWLTPTVVALAESIYQHRAFDRMPILADALMDSGCDNEDILNHCRQPGEHVRGCWVVDLLTGRK